MLSLRCGQPVVRSAQAPGGPVVYLGVWPLWTSLLHLPVLFLCWGIFLKNKTEAKEIKQVRKHGALANDFHGISALSRHSTEASGSLGLAANLEWRNSETLRSSTSEIFINTMLDRCWQQICGLSNKVAPYSSDSGRQLSISRLTPCASSRIDLERERWDTMRYHLLRVLQPVVFTTRATTVQPGAKYIETRGMNHASMKLLPSRTWSITSVAEALACLKSKAAQGKCSESESAIVECYSSLAIDGYSLLICLLLLHHLR